MALCNTVAIQRCDATTFLTPACLAVQQDQRPLAAHTSNTADSLNQDLHR